MLVTAERVKRFAPTARADLVSAIVDHWDAADEASINTPLRVQHFFAQVATETGGLKAVEENLRYSAERLRAVFPKYVKTTSQAKGLANKPKEIANLVYGGRLGNRPGTDDGWDFRGGGMMQTTGRTNYEKLGFDEEPEALREPVTAFLTAVREWQNRGCNAIADKDDVVTVRKKINGGTNGLDECRDYLAAAKRVFLGEGAPAPLPRQAPAGVATSLTREELREIQQRLDDAGYHGVGQIDGLWGNRTRDALNAFRADNNLPLTVQPPRMGDATLTKLLNEAVAMRPTSATRAKATTKDIVEDAPVIAKPVVRASWWANLMKWLGLGGLFGGVSLDQIAPASKQFAEIKDSLDFSMPWWFWFGLFVAVLFGASYGYNRIKAGMKETYADGKLV